LHGGPRLLASPPFLLLRLLTLARRRLGDGALTAFALGAFLGDSLRAAAAAYGRGGAAV